MLEYTNSAMRELFYKAGGGALHHQLPVSLTTRIKAGCARLGNGVFSVFSLHDCLPKIMQAAPSFDVSGYEYAVNTLHLQHEINTDLFKVSYGFTREFAKSIADAGDLGLDVTLTFCAEAEYGPQSVFTFYQNGVMPVIDVNCIEAYSDAIAVFRVLQRKV